MVKIGLIGFGNIGSTHAKYLMAGKIPNAELAALCDINPKKIEKFKELYGADSVAFFDDYKKLIASGLVDAVIVAVPHYFHVPMATDALNAGLHVISEKPIGVYTKNVRELNELAKKTDRVFAIMYNQRTNPVFQKMRSMVQNGELGDLKRSVWIITDWYRPQSYYNSGGWRATWDGEGGGVLINQCPHNLDLWQWISGMPKRVTSFCQYGKYHDIEVEDEVTAYVEYENGATGLFVTTTGEAPGTNRLEISGTLGKIVYEGGNIIKHWKLGMDEREFNRTWDGGFGNPDCVYEEIAVEGEETAHAGITQNFANAIEKGGKLLSPGIEGINGLTISNAIHLSSFLGKTVELPLDEDLYLEELGKRRKTSRFKKEAEDRILDTEGTY